MKNKKIFALAIIILFSFILLWYSLEKRAPAFPNTGSLQTLRVLQYNVHHGGVGTDGKANQDRVATAAAAQNADLISLNEIEQFTGYSNHDNVGIYKQLLAQKTGKQWNAFFFQTNGQWASNGQGNAILTTLDVQSSDHKKLGPGRVAGVVTLQLGSQSINFFSTHLDNVSAAERLSEAKVLRDWIATFTTGISILAGDMNASSSDPEIILLKNILTDSWAQAKIDGTAISATDNPNGNTRSTRIDYIFYPKGQIALNGAEVPDTRDSKGVMPSDHRPVLAKFTLNVTTPPTPPPPSPTADVIIHANGVSNTNIHGNWAKISDATAADGIRLYNTDLQAAKITVPKAAPADYYDVTFTAVANTPYHLWLRMKAQNNAWASDSVYIQFSDAIDQNGKPIAGLTTANAWIGYLEEGTNAGLSGWGWNDNNYGGLGSNISFTTTGSHTIRIQSREDGVSIDQIILSPVKYLQQAPGSLKNDNIIVE